MSAPSLIWMPGSNRHSPGWLHGRLLDTFGADLLGLWIGEDVVADGLGVVANWPGRAGATLVNAGTGNFSRETSNGRLAIKSVAGALTYRLSAVLASPVAAVLTVWKYTIPGATFQVVADSPANDGAIQIAAGGSPIALYVAGSWSHYINGVASENLTYGTHIVEADSATTLSTAFHVGSLAAGGLGPKEPVFMTCALSAIPTALKRTAANADIKTYYSTLGLS